MGLIDNQFVSGRAWRDASLVALVAGCVFFLNLGGPALWDEDEPKNAACTREMLVRGDPIVPSFNDELRTDKPILIYWLMLAAYQLFGVNEFAARLPSAALSVGTCLLTWSIGRKLYGAKAGLCAGIVLATCLLFGISARAATTDATLVFCTTLAFATFSGSLNRSNSGWGDAVGIFGPLGLAVLAKGPTGYLLPVLAMGLFVWRTRLVLRMPDASGWRALVRDELSRLNPRLAFPAAWQAASSIGLFRGTLVTLIVALPWYVLVGISTDWVWPRLFLSRHNVSRYLSAMEGHDGPFVYYLATIAVGTIPWSLPAIAGIIAAIRRRLTAANGGTADRFLLCWLAIYLVFFSLSRTKLPSYILPCFPAMALLAGRLLVEWIEIADTSSPWIRRLTFDGMAAAGLGLVVACIAAGKSIPEFGSLIWFAVPILAGGNLASWLARRGKIRSAVGVYGLCSAALLCVGFGIVADRVAARQTSEPLMTASRTHRQQEAPLGAYGQFKPGLVFYSGRRVHRLWTDEQALRFLSRFPDGHLITPATLLAQFAHELPPEFEVLHRVEAFFKPGQEFVLVGRRNVSSSLDLADPARLSAKDAKPAVR